VEWVNTDTIIADLPSRPLTGRGEPSKITPPLVELPIIFISEADFNKLALLFKKWRD